MMLEVFRALRTINFVRADGREGGEEYRRSSPWPRLPFPAEQEWKVVAQYQLVCRPAARPAADAMGGSEESAALLRRSQVRLGLQLYKVVEDQCLLDVKRLSGDIFPFMDMCSSLLCELKL